MEISNLPDKYVKNNGPKDGHQTQEKNERTVRTSTKNLKI